MKDKENWRTKKMKDKEKQNISMKEMLTKRSLEPITNCNCKIKSRIDYAVRNENKDGAFVDLLNQEQAELQKAMIEEMAKDYYGYSIDLEEDCKFVAKEMYDKGHRKLPEDSVVLSREEYEKLKSLYDCEQGSIMTSNIGDLPLTIEGLRKAVDEITRLNRVEAELQELNAKYYNEAKDLRRELKQSSKETAKEILERGKYCMPSGLRDWIKERYGVEV